MNSDGYYLLSSELYDSVTYIAFVNHDFEKQWAYRYENDGFMQMMIDGNYIYYVSRRKAAFSDEKYRYIHKFNRLTGAPLNTTQFKAYDRDYYDDYFEMKQSNNYFGFAEYIGFFYI